MKLEEIYLKIKSALNESNTNISKELEKLQINLKYALNQKMLEQLFTNIGVVL